MASRQPSQVVLPDCQAPAGSVVKSQATSPGLPAHTSLHQTSPSSMVAKEASAHCPSLQPSMAALSQRELPLSQASPVVSATATKPNSPAGSRLSSQIVPPDASHASGSAAVSQAPMSPLAGPCQSGPEMQTFAHHQSLHTYAAPGTQQPEALTNVPSTANAAVTQPTSAVMSRQPSLVALSNGQLPPAGSEEALHAPPSPGPVPASAQTSVHTPSVATAPLPTSPTPGGSPVPCHTPAKAPGTPELPRQPSQAPLETTQLAVESVAASPAPASPVAGPKSSVHSASQHSLAAKDTSAVGASWHPSVAASPSHVSPSPRASPAVTKPASPVTPRQPSPVHPSAAPPPAFSVAVSRASPQPSPTPKSLHSASVLSPETEARSSSRESSIESVVLATAPTLPLTEKQSHASATSHPGAASRASLQPSIVISPPTPDLPAEGSIGTRSAPRTGPQSAKQSAAASPRSSAHPSPRSSSPPVSQAEPSPEAPPQLSQATSSGAADQQLKQSLQASRASPSLPPVTSHQPSVTEAANPTPSPGLSGQRSRVSVAQSPTSLRAMSRQPSVASVTGTIAPKDTTLPPSDDAPKPMSPVPRSPNAASPSLAGAKSLEQLADQATAQQPSGARSPSALKPVTSSEAPQSKDASGVQPATPPTGQTSHVGTSPPLPATPPQASVAAAIEETSQVPSATNLATPGVQSPKNSTAPISRASPYASQLAAARSRASLNRSQASPKDTRPASQHPSIAAASNSVAGSPPRSALSLPKSEHASPALSPTRVPSSVEPVAALVEGKSHDAEPNSNVARSVHGGHPLSQRGSQASVVKDEAPALPAVASLPLHVSMVKSRSQLSEPAAPSAHASRLQVEAEVEPVVVVEQLASPGQAPTSPAGPATSTPHSPQASMAKSHAPSPQRSSLHDSQLLSTAAAKDGTKAVSEVHEVAQPAGSAATSPRCSQLPTNVTRSPTATAHEPSVHTTASTPGQGPVNAKGVSNASGDPAARPTSPRISAAPSPPSRQSAMSAVVADGIKSPVPAPGPSGQASLGSPVAAGSETPNTIENRSMIGPTEPAVLSTTALAAEASSHQLPVETGAQAISNQELSIPRAEPEPELAPASTSPALPPSQLPPPTMLSKSIEAIRAIGSTSQHALSQSTSKATQTLATATPPPEPLVASRAHTGSQPPSVHDGPTPQPKPEDTSVADNSRMTRTSTAERIQQIRRPSISQLLERQASGNVSSQRSRASRTASQIEPSPAQPSQTGALESRSPEKVVTPSPPPESPRMIESPIWEPENNEKKITPKAAPSASNASHPLLAEASATSMSASQLEDQEQKLQELRSVLVTLSKSLAHLHSEAPSHPALAQLGSTAAIAEIDKQLEAVHQEQKQQSEAPPQASQLTHRSGSHLAPEAAATAQDQPASYHSTNAPSDSVDVLSEDASVHTMTPISSPKGWVGSGSAARLASSAVLDSQPSPKQGGEPTAVPLPKAAQLSQPSLLSVSQADHEVAELARVLSDPHSAAVPPAAALTDSHYSPVVISNRSSPHTVTPIRNGSRHSSPPAVTRVPTRSGSPLPAAIGGEGTSPIRQSSPDPQGRGANDSFFTGSLGSSLLHSPLDASPHPSGKASPQHSNSVVLDPQAVDAALASSIESSPGVDMAEEQRRLDALTEAVHTSAAALATVEAVTSAVKAGSLSVATYQDPPQLPPSPNVSHVARIPLPLSRSASAIHTSSIQVAGPEAVVDATPAPALRTSAEVSSAAPAPVADSHGASHGNFHPSKVVSTVQSRVASFEAQSQAPAAIAPSAVPSRKSSRSSSGQSTFDQAINFPLPASVATFVGQATSAGLGTSQRSSPRSPQARPVQASGNSHLPTAVKASLLAPAGTSRAPSAIASAIQEPERQADAVHVPQIVDEMVDQLHDVTGVLNSLMDGHPDFMEPITDVIRLVQSTVLNSIDHVARSLVSQRSTHPLATTEAAIVPSAPEIDVVAGYTSVQPAAQDKPVSASINGTPHRSENHASRVPSPAPMLSPKPSPTPARASQTPEVAKKTAEPSNAKCALQPSRPPSPRPMTAPPMANGAAMNTSATCSSLSSAQRSPMVSTAAALSQLLITKEKTLSPRQSVHGLPNASMVAPGSAAVAQPLPDPAPLPIHATTSPQKSPSTSVVSSKEKSATTEPSAASPPEANADAVTQPVNAAGSHSPTIPPTKISSVSETYTPAVVTGPVEILPTPSGPTSRGESTGKSATKASAPQSPPADPVQAPTVSSTRLTPPGRRTPQPYQQPGASMQSRHDSRASGAPPPPPPPPESHGAQPLNASISSVRSADHGSLPSLQSDSSSIASYDPQVEPSTPSPLLAERRPTGECSDHPSIAVSISGDPSCAEGIPVGFTPGDGGPPHDGGHHSFYHHRSGSGLWQDSVHGSYHYYRTFSERYPGYQQQYSYSQHQHAHHRTAGAPPYGQGGGKSPPTSAPTADPGFPTMANRGGQFPTGFACCPLGQPHSTEYQADKNHDTSNTRFTADTTNDTTGFRFSTGRGGRWEHAPVTSTLPSRKPKRSSRPPKSASASDIIDIPVVHYSANSPQDFRVDEAVADELHRGTQKIVDLGFRDYRTVHRVLKQSGGDVEVAIKRLEFMQAHPV
ncbi:hypothetical protein H4R34_002103 [Dimargaris verticillata]|uniref:UBA domain-containing protein n=1 Tax=Dimargaris verticillata TaxID=2761393 RepID=A0A9W8B4T6_9FUNG|nr:hypothetical protein H4R34_002103 [Dimargaris verticillata]